MSPIVKYNVVSGTSKLRNPRMLPRISDFHPGEFVMPIIQVQDLCKTFHTKEGTVTAADHISFSVEKGDIYGIIGLSGAGKSTLVRCLNLLEKPDSGDVKIGGASLLEMKPKQLRTARQNIGMIFQHFNLLMQRNVLDNICFPMEIAGVPRQEAKKRAMEMLSTVDMTEKARAYPSQLSGGQKQRVAIARVLANNPEILLCDEATSALDPQTTKSILDLLMQINRSFGIPIVVITHEMSVVQQICNHVAVLDSGRLVETGTVREIFEAPKTEAAKRLIIGKTASGIELMQGRRVIRIIFDGQSSYEPVIGNVTLQFQTPVNILYAATKDLGGSAVGEMILQLPEDQVTGDRMIQYLKDRKIKVEELKDYA